MEHSRGDFNCGLSAVVRRDARFYLAAAGRLVGRFRGCVHAAVLVRAARRCSCWSRGWGRISFPSTDAGQFKLHVRTKTAMRIEETANVCDQIEAAIRRIDPADEVASIIDNIGLAVLHQSVLQHFGADRDHGRGYSGLAQRRSPSDGRLCSRIARASAARISGRDVRFPPADIISQILNFGLPAPIDVQVVGLDIDASRDFAVKLLNQLKHVPGTADLHIHQSFDQPKLHINVDRTKAAESGFTEKDVANSMLIALSGSFQTTPAFWLNPEKRSELQPDRHSRRNIPSAR